MEPLFITFVIIIPLMLRNIKIKTCAYTESYEILGLKKIAGDEGICNSNPS